MITQEACTQDQLNRKQPSSYQKTTLECFENFATKRQKHYFPSPTTTYTDRSFEYLNPNQSLLQALQSTELTVYQFESF